jgi:hypothetical protein
LFVFFGVRQMFLLLRACEVAVTESGLVFFLVLIQLSFAA